MKCKPWRLWWGHRVNELWRLCEHSDYDPHFLSKNNQLIYQAGAGIVSKSDNQSELQEVNNKLEALRKAILLAETIWKFENLNYENFGAR